jgi:Yip1-like protein
METAASAQPLPEQPKSEFSRLTGVIWEPGATFRDIAAHPRWWPPVALIIVLSLVFMYSFTQHVGWERYMRQQFETNPSMQKMDSAQRDAAMAQGARFAPIMGYVGSVVGFPIFALAAAGVFLLVFRVMLGANLSYRQVFALYCYSAIPLVFANLMALAVMLLKDPDQFDLQNPTLTNIGAFLDPLSTPKWLHSLGSSIDVFALWLLALLATGLSAGARKLSWGTSMAAVVGVWAVFVLIKVGWAAITG